MTAPPRLDVGFEAALDGDRARVAEALVYDPLIDLMTALAARIQEVPTTSQAEVCDFLIPAVSAWVQVERGWIAFDDSPLRRATMGAAAAQFLGSATESDNPVLASFACRRGGGRPFPFPETDKPREAQYRRPGRRRGACQGRERGLLDDRCGRKVSRYRPHRSRGWVRGPFRYLRGAQPGGRAPAAPRVRRHLEGPTKWLPVGLPRTVPRRTIFACRMRTRRCRTRRGTRSSRPASFTR
jgi:hypothetical protein